MQDASVTYLFRLPIFLICHCESGVLPLEAIPCFTGYFNRKEIAAPPKGKSTLATTYR